MDALPLAQPVRKRGRPPGSSNKRSGDLRRYVEAVYGGLTPGQQAAAIGLVNAKEVKAAGGVLEAMVVKASVLADFLKIKPGEAWALMQRERADLMPYIHQRLASLEVTAPGDGPGLPLILMPDPAPQAVLDLGEGVGFQVLSDVEAGQVAQSKSHGDEQTLTE